MVEEFITPKGKESFLVKEFKDILMWGNFGRVVPILVRGVGKDRNFKVKPLF